MNLSLQKVHFIFNMLEHFNVSNRSILYDSDNEKIIMVFKISDRNKKSRIDLICCNVRNERQKILKFKLTLSQTESRIVYLT